MNAHDSIRSYRKAEDAAYLRHRIQSWTMVAIVVLLTIAACYK